MEVKHNESTELRPEGGRLIDAPLVSIDIPQYIKQLKSEAAWTNGDRNAITVFKTQEMRIVLIALHEDAIISKHVAEGMISVQVIEGEINFNTDAQSVLIKKGHMIALHKGMYHSVAATKESVFLLTIANG